MLSQNIGKWFTGVLATLICVEDFRFTIAVYGFLQGIDTKATFQAVRELSAQHPATVPVHDYGEINRAWS